MQCDGDIGGGRELHDRCGIHAEREWSAGCDVEYCGQCDGESADGGVERDGGDVVGDNCDWAGGFECGDDGGGRDSVLRIDDYGGDGSDGDGAVGMRAVIGADHVQSDTWDCVVDGSVHGGGVWDADIRPGSDDGYGICGARGGNWRRAWIAAGDDDFGWCGVDVPAEAAGGVDVCDIVVGGDGVGGLQ